MQAATDQGAPGRMVPAMNPLEEVLKDGPKTTIATENNQVVITVEARHLKPLDAKIADVEGSLAAWGVVIGATWMGLTVEDAAVMASVLGLGGVVGRRSLQRYARQHSEEVTTVRFTETGIGVLQPPSGLRPAEWKYFDSRLQHRFVRLTHDWAQDEMDKHAYQNQNSPGARRTRYYSDAYFVVLEQLGQRYDIAEVMGERRADEILARLTLCDEYMKGVVNERKRIPMRPEDQWSVQTGSVPQ